VCVFVCVCARVCVCIIYYTKDSTILNCVLLVCVCVCVCVCARARALARVSAYVSLLRFYYVYPCVYCESRMDQAIALCAEGQQTWNFF
jgi:hypothetical protein